MSVKLKKLNEQVMVLTGATSGIGLVTARTAADAGVKLVLAARDCYSAIGGAPSEIRIAGGAARSKALKTLIASGLGVPAVQRRSPSCS